MSTVRTLRPAAVAALVCLSGFGSQVWAEPDKAAADKAAWETRRKTSPENVTELKALQARVKDVVAKTTPSTVGLLVGAGAGSGVIVSEDGLVLTAAHVIGKPGRDITFVLSDGSRVKGKALGLNTKADSGMAKITDPPPKNAKWPGAADGKWPAAQIGKGTELAKGQWVVSLGHPGGPKDKRPPPVRVGRFENYDKDTISLRSDCTLVGGDSGGPLFDLDGKVVGIHSRIGLWLEFNMHVPTDAFKDEWDQLVKGERVGRQNNIEMGVTLDDDEERPTVKEVTSGGLGDKAGFKVGDVILKVDGDKVDSADDFNHSISLIDPNQREFTVDVRREQKTVSLKVQVNRRPQQKRERKKDNEE